ncbi:MAG: DeoR/GlpR family DNA-binding transcription regulator [Acidobacteria bacterium]|nr:DeoR/GlpR family DNA-binding transcription regulator [Acidobacteriota bacterium]
MATDTEAISERGQKILDELFRNGNVKVEDLAAALGISPITVRRELAQLARQGRLRRTRGGALPVEPLFYEPFRHDSTFQEQIDQCAEEKRRIAAAAGELIEENQMIALTAGTTTTLVSRSIPHNLGITVVTNTINMAMELSNRSDLNVFVTGGFLHRGWFSLVGAAAVEAMRQVFVDNIFIGVNAIDASAGITAFHPDEAAIDRIMVGQARRKIVVADHNKLGLVTNYVVCPASEIDLIITDTGATDDIVEPFLNLGIEVRRV